MIKKGDHPNLKYANSSSNYYVIMIYKISKILKSKIFNFLRIHVARSADLKQTITSKRLLFAQDTSWSDLARVAR